MKTENGCTPAQQYQIHRARSARWEQERHRQTQFNAQRSTKRATVEAIVVAAFWVGIVVLGLGLLRALPV